MTSDAPIDTPHPAIARIRTYFSAYHDGSSEDYATQWTYPAGLYSEGRWVVVPDAVTMARQNDAYALAQRAAGAVGGEILQLEATPIGADAALVRGRFARLRADGNRLDEVLASYLVVRLADAAGAGQAAETGAWKVAVCLTGR